MEEITVTTTAEQVAVPMTTAEQDRHSAAERLAAKTTAPTTTAEQDRKTASQRRVNIIWEVEQAIIANVFICTSAGIAVWMIYRGLQVPLEAQVLAMATAAFIFLTNTVSTVVGFYFGRTNHEKSGGIGGDEAGRR
jgi:formate/nitrite transporter FocA (FNT family)